MTGCVRNLLCVSHPHRELDLAALDLGDDRRGDLLVGALLDVLHATPPADGAATLAPPGSSMRIA